jgi:hypothetical protein
MDVSLDLVSSLQTPSPTHVAGLEADRAFPFVCGSGCSSGQPACPALTGALVTVSRVWSCSLI